MLYVCCDPHANNDFKRVSVSMHALLLFSLCVSVCVCWGGVATQTEATLISVLESNLACVQNGSLYQLGGSLPCLESGGSSSSSDASLMTAWRAQPDDHLLQRPVVYWSRTRKRLFVFYHHWSNCDPSYEWPLSIDTILKAATAVVFWWLMGFWGAILIGFVSIFYIPVLHLHYTAWTRVW